MRIRKSALATLALAVALGAATAPACADDIRNVAVVHASLADGSGGRWAGWDDQLARLIELLARDLP